MARVAAGAMGVAQGMRQEAELRIKEQFERLLSSMDLVTREEFEAVRAMAVKAREEQESLAKRLAALEARPDTRKAAKPRTRKAGAARKRKMRPKREDRPGK
jgi:BMFP domain-containing protein YqiC